MEPPVSISMSLSESVWFLAHTSPLFMAINDVWLLSVRWSLIASVCMSLIGGRLVEAGLLVQKLCWEVLSACMPQMRGCWAWPKWGGDLGAKGFMASWCDAKISLSTLSIYTLGVKSWNNCNFLKFLKEISYSHYGCIYFMKNTLKQ